MPSAFPGASERRSAHLVGICGSGLKSLATLLLDRGWAISGSDLSVTGESGDGLRARGIDVREGHAFGNVPRGTQLLIYSAAVPSDNPERAAARTLGIPERSYSQMLGELMRGGRGIGIAGTHGKSTTAAMTASVLRAAGRDPSACIGAELSGLGNGGWAGHSDLFVAECCEFRRSFLDLSPTYAAILNIEADHFDCFHDFSETREAFGQFAARVPSNGLLVVRTDCGGALGGAARVETFAIGTPATWTAEDLRPTLDGVSFDLIHRGGLVGRVALRVPGRHNVLNALATIALCHGIGLHFDEIQSGLAEFRGIRRRFEFLGTPNGITWIDDFAHHPTEVRATLETARQRYGSRRIWCLFQPHQVSRLRMLLPEFAGSFDRADQVLIAPAFVAREIRSEEADSLARQLAQQIARAGPPARFCADLDRIVATVDDEARAGDVVISMGAGDINRVYHAFTRRLQRNLAS
ncbi:MAG TPA: UDP-N-acetylmuramate--L-alanine ligase [Planctomycetaceae bacterium]|nr:UDP-N-acetylmuramate--L-alanine ligase [Planctomycetaceae bacterium]